MASNPTEIVSANPARRDDVVLRVVPSGAIDVERMVSAARAGRREWSGMPATARADALMRVAAAVEAEAGPLAELVCREAGKPITEARGEVARTAAIFRFHAAAALDPDGETYPPADGRTLVMARRRPRGVVGLITPWNFPIAIPAWKLAPALAYGNVCVWKPSELAPACAAELHRIITSQLPPIAVQLLQGYGDAGAALVSHPGVSAVSFTGSEATGKRVSAAMVARGAPVQCEMGGQNASLVLADANIESAAAVIASAAMGYAGQKCTATSRVICEPGVGDAMREALVAAVERMPVVDPASDACLVGPVISDAALDRAVAAVERACADGGMVLTGGDRLDADGSYMAPTVVEITDPATELGQEEVFAPVCALIDATSADAAVEIANGVRHGLATSIFTSDLDRALDLVERVDSGLVRVNLPTSGVDFHAPFGGEKASGIGPREQGKAAREFYTSWRTISIAPSA